MGIFKNIGNVMKFGYNATQTKNSRRYPKTTIENEDEVLNQYKRRKLVSTTQDQVRNISLVAWMFRKHLDYVSKFSYHPMTNSDELNNKLEFLWHQWSRKKNCDIAERHSLNMMIRLFESSKIMHGDAGLLKLNNGKLQGIESIRIAKPQFNPNNSKIDLNKISDHGLVLDQYGRAIKYSLCTIKQNTLQFQKLVTADQLLFDGYFTRFDQTRGVSPLASAINTFQDLYESWEYQLIKAKMHAMFGIAIMSEGSPSDGNGFYNTNAIDGTAPNSSTISNGGYKFDIKPGLKMHLKPGDSIATIESKTPSAEFRDYSELMSRIGMSALDIPYSLFDSGKSNFSAMKQDRVEYETSAKVKQEANRDILVSIAEWKHQQWLNTGMLGNVSLSDIKFDFRSAGRPWIEEVKEIDAAQRRIDSGLSSRQREAKKRGQSFFEILDELEHEQKLIKQSGVSIISGTPGQTTTDERTKSEDNSKQGEK